MAETKKPARATAPPVPARPVPLPAPVRADGGELIEDVNEQLARFLEHADQLVEEWAKFAVDVRRTVDSEVARIDGAVADATERALQNASAQVDRVAADRIEKTVEHAVARWRGEPPAPRVSGGGTSAANAGAGASRGLIGAILLADALLVVLLILALRKDSPAPSENGGGGGASGGVTTIIAPEVLAACDSLAEGTWSPDEAALVLRAGTAVCGDDEAKVTATVTAHFAGPGSGEAAIDAGVVDATPPIDAKKRPGK
ncbi:MAG TPA: hypothetical protein VM261_35780 [Kofleriaceae bacterium]|nr:hypothetical protein [Kofleriaceae bacterium]